MSSPAVVAFPPQSPAPPALPQSRAGLLTRLLTRALKPQTSFDRVPSSGAGNFYLVQQSAGKVGPSNAATYRLWSIASPWVRAAIDIRRDQVATAEWDIVPLRRGGKAVNARSSVRLANQIRDLFERPNPVDGSFSPFVQRLVEDLLTLDAAVAEKVRTPAGRLAELWPTPGEYIHVNTRWDGSNPDDPRYFWVPDGVERKRLRNDDLLYMMQNPRTISPVGVSPLEILKVTIDSELQATEYNRRQVMGAAPDGVLNIGDDAPPEKVEQARSFWQSEVLGKGAFAIIGGYQKPNFLKFRDTNREMQFREWEDLLIRAIAIVFGLSPMDLAITFDVNRSTADAQTQNSEDRGLRPLMALLQDYFTREIVHDESFGGPENGLAFRFTALNLKETKQKADINKIAVTAPWKSVDEARIDDGREPLGGIFEHIISVTPKGLLDLTEGRYIGEAEFAKASADAQIAVEEAKGEIAAASAAKQPDESAPADK